MALALGLYRRRKAWKQHKQDRELQEIRRRANRAMEMELRGGPTKASPTRSGTDLHRSALWNERKQEVLQREKAVHEREIALGLSPAASPVQPVDTRGLCHGSPGGREAEVLELDDGDEYGQRRWVTKSERQALRALADSAEPAPDSDRRQMLAAETSFLDSESDEDDGAGSEMSCITSNTDSSATQAGDLL